MMIGIGLGISRGGAGSGGAPPEPDKTLVVDTFLADGTWTEPAEYWSPAGEASKVRVQAWGSGGGGTTATGAGGGGAFAQTDDVAPGGNAAVTVGVIAAANTNGEDSSFGAFVVAKGGLSGTNGSTGGTAAASTGTTKFSGGDGGVGAGNTVGGGGAGDTAAGSTATPGASTGGFNSVAAAGRWIGSGGASTGAGQFAGGRGEVRVTYDIEATAGFPRVRGRSWGRDVADGTSRAATMPANIAAGELLLLVVASDGIPDITVAGWTKLGQESESGSQVAMAVFYKTAAGADTATIATDASQQVNYQVWRIADAGTPEMTDTSTLSTNPNPPAHTPSGGSAKYLWIVAAGWDQQTDVTGIPADFGSLITTPPFNAFGPALCGCERLLEADTLDPGTFTSVNEQWCAATISIPPA